MIRFKDWATAKGAIDWLWIKNQPRRHLRYGACLPNGPGDDGHLADISGECARVPDHQAVQYSCHGKHDFYIATIGRKDESHEEIALQIAQIESVCNPQRLPVYWLVWNEEHERHEADVQKVRKAYVDLFPSRFPRAKFIVKAAYKSCVEEVKEVKTQPDVVDAEFSEAFGFEVSPAAKAATFVCKFGKYSKGKTLREVGPKGLIGLCKWVMEQADGKQNKNFVELIVNSQEYLRGVKELSLDQQMTDWLSDDPAPAPVKDDLDMPEWVTD